MRENEGMTKGASRGALKREGLVDMSVVQPSLSPIRRGERNP